nr:hypothetical protein CFP56_49767 [Quercus suber]
MGNAYRSGPREQNAFYEYLIVLYLSNGAKEMNIKNSPGKSFLVGPRLPTKNNSTQLSIPKVPFKRKSNQA